VLRPLKSDAAEPFRMVSPSQPKANFFGSPHFGGANPINVKERSNILLVSASCWLLRPADGINIMRYTHMRQAHKLSSLCVFTRILRMRLKQKEIYF
jgi:hypothetical protein